MFLYIGLIAFLFSYKKFGKNFRAKNAVFSRSYGSGHSYVHREFHRDTMSILIFFYSIDSDLLKSFQQRASVLREVLRNEEQVGSVHFNIVIPALNQPEKLEPPNMLYYKSYTEP